MNPDKSQEEINKEVHEALFGANGQIGLIEKMDDVWEVLSAFKMFGKAVMWVALLLGAIGTAWMAFWPGIKKLIIGH